MTSKVASVLKDAAKSVVKSAKDAGEAFAKHIEATGRKLKGDAKAHKETDSKSADGITKAGSKKPDELPKSSASKADKSAADRTAEEKAAAEKEAADKAAAEKAAADAKAAAEKAAATKAKVAQLRTEGHAPQRHLDATDQQLEQRLGQPVMQGPKGKQTVAMQNGYVSSTKKVDPANTTAHSLPDGDPNKYLDNYSKNAAGNPNKHKCGSFSTAFGSEQSMVDAEAAARAKIPASATDNAAVSIDAKTAIGDDGMNALRGKYIDPANPQSGGKINYKDVNFDNSTILAIYNRPTTSDPWKLTTMYPEPDKTVNT